MFLDLNQVLRNLIAEVSVLHEWHLPPNRNLVVISDSRQSCSWTWHTIDGIRWSIVSVLKIDFGEKPGDAGDNETQSYAVHYPR